MSNDIRLKRRAAGGASGAPATLKTTEPAFNEQDSTLYLGVGDNGSGVATSVIPIGGKGAFVDLTSAQTVAGVKTFSVSPSVPTPTGANDAGNKSYIDGKFPSITGGTGTKITYNSSGLITSATTLAAADIPTLTASKISDFDTQVRTSRLDQMAAPTSAVPFNSQRITGLADPTANTDAVTKQYADALSTGNDWKQSARIATTANDTLSGLAARDGVTPNAGDRVAAIAQSTGSQNGIYIAAAGAWARATDADQNAEVTSGLSFFVEEGSTNAGKQYVLTTANPITVGTTSLTFSQFGGGTTYTAAAGGGLSLTGSAFSAVGTTNRISVGSTIDISASYVGQTSITTLGTVATGTWNASIIGLAYGGAGANLSSLSDGTILKKVGTALVAAIAGTDYLSPSSTIDGGTF